MYGTAARIQLKPGKEQEMVGLSQQEVPDIPGFVFQHIYRLDAGTDDYYLAVAFESKESYKANAESPEQHARYEQYRELLESESKWHDGEIIFSQP